MYEKSSLKKTDFDYTFKIIIVGDKGVGKTTLLHRFLKGKFLMDTKETIGVEIFNKKLLLNNMKYSLQLWDLGGDEHFRRFQNTYLIGADAGILMFDLTREETVKALHTWIEICRINDKNLPILLIGSKADIKKEIKFDDDIGEELGIMFDCITYIKTSSKTGLNVLKAFQILIKIITKIKNKQKRIY